MRLETRDYQLVYQGSLDSMAVVEKNPVDASRLKQHRIAWAGFGLRVVFPYFPLLTDAILIGLGMLG